MRHGSYLRVRIGGQNWDHSVYDDFQSEHMVWALSSDGKGDGNSQQRLYRNGVLVDSSSTSRPNEMIFNNIGHGFSSAVYVWTGDIEYVYYFKAKLSADEINRIYRDPYHLFEPHRVRANTIGLVIQASASDTLKLSDSASKTLTIQVTASDTLFLGDSTLRNKIVFAQADETIIFSDSADKNAIIQALASDQLNLSGDANMIAILRAIASDTLQLSDSAIGVNVSTAATGEVTVTITIKKPGISFK
jgi:hypothetical protein